MIVHSKGMVMVCTPTGTGIGFGSGPGVALALALFVRRRGIFHIAVGPPWSWGWEQSAKHVQFSFGLIAFGWAKRPGSMK